MPSASLAVTPVLFISPSPSAQKPSQSSVPPIPLATAPTRRSPSSSVIPLPAQRTSAKPKPIPLSSKSPSPRFSTPSSAISEPPHDPARFLRPLARPHRLLTRRRSFISFASQTSSYSGRRLCRPPRPRHSRLRRRLSPQASHPHHHRPLRPHPQSPLLRQQHPRARRRHRHELLALRRPAPFVFRARLHPRHAPRRNRAPRPSRRRIRRLRKIRPTFFPLAKRGQATSRHRRLFLLGPIPQKPRI